MEKIKEFLIQFIDAAQKQKKVILALSCFVVFITTYLLILPAFTLEKDKAIEQGGIDVPGEVVSQEGIIEEDVDFGNDSAGIADDNQKIEQGKNNDAQSSDSANEPLAYDGNNFTISVEDKDSILPDNTEIRVTEIDKNTDSKTYNGYYGDALTALQAEAGGSKISDLEFAKFYDIKLVADGKEIKLSDNDTVNVRIDYNKDLRKDLNVENKDNVRIIHFAEDKKTGKEEAEVLDNKDANVEINTDNKDRLTDMSFEAGSFSVYAIVYTVDFSYEVNGNTYSFSMQGADSVSLRDLIAALHVYESDSSDKETKDELTASDLETVDKDEGINSDKVDAFMANIKDVTFSDPKLLAVIKVDQKTTLGEINANNGILQHFTLNSPQKEVIERNAKAFDAGDWALISLKPFDTKETLSIEMENGETFSINVTDAQDAPMNGEQVQTIANPAGTTIDLFDYWILDSLRDAEGRSAWPGEYQGEKDGWKNDWEYTPDGGYGFTLLVGGQGTEQGINAGHPFKFSPAWEHTVRDGTSTSSNSNGSGLVNSYTGNGNPNQGLVASKLIDGYPQLSNNKEAGNESLSYLFDTSLSHNGKASYGNVDQLLYVDKEGYYTYDSRDYAAAFDKSSKTFTVTEQTSDNTEVRGFWPFGTQNFWTGMHMNTQFSMPANGQVLNPQGEHKDMQFEFSGDDDTWLYVDGVLVGDGGGIHNRTEIDINFASGTVTVTGKKDANHPGSFEETQYLDDIFRAAGEYKDSDWEDIPGPEGLDEHGTRHKRFKAGTYHTFDMFYLERGGGESNLYIHYNLISTSDFTAHKSYKSYNLDGTVNSDDALKRNQFKFELIGYDDENGNEAIMPLVGDANGDGTVESPLRVHNDEEGYTSLIIGVSEDGNINFGNIELTNADLGKEFSYMVREVIPEDAEVVDGKYVKDGITYDNKVFYFTGKVVETPTGFKLQKTRYKDPDHQIPDTDTTFSSFDNSFTPVPGSFEFDKIDSQGNTVPGAEFTLFTDARCKRPAKNSDGNAIVAQSGSNGKVSFTNVPAYQTYYMKETVAPTGYLPNETIYEVHVVPDSGQDSSSTMIVYGDESKTALSKVINIRPGEITVKKAWQDADGNDTQNERPVNVTLKRKKSEVPEGTPEYHVTFKFHIDDRPDWGLTNMNLEREETVHGYNFIVEWYDSWQQYKSLTVTDAEGNPLNEDQWHVWSIDKDGHSKSIGVYGINSDIVVEVQYESKYAWLWQDQDPDHHYQRTTNPVIIPEEYTELVEDDDFNGESVELSSPDYTKIWTAGGDENNHEEFDVPAYDSNGRPYYYYVEEESVEGYETSYSNNDGITEGIITVTNKKIPPPSGSLKLTKVVTVDGNAPAADAQKSLVDGDYTFKIESAEGVTPSITRFVQITVSNGLSSSYKVSETEVGLRNASSLSGEWAVVSGLAEGNYTITEIGFKGLTLVAAARGDSDGEAVSSDKAVTVHVTAGQDEPADNSAAAAKFTNNIETVTAKIVKVWDHTGNTGTRPTTLTVTLSNGEIRELNEDNNWTAEVTALPKYDHTTGNLIEYSWTEAVLPVGYYLSDIQETTDGTTGVVTTTLTNSYTDHYNPMTTISGKKIWDDGDSSERPSSITVNLYKDGGTTPYRTITVQAPTGEGANQNEWPFEFTNLPVFNSDGSVIQYTVEEVLPEGYTDEYGIKIEFSQATYVAGDTTGTIVPSGQGMRTIKVSDGSNLGYIVIMHGHDFIIWTPRPATNAEITAIKTKVVGLSDQFSGINSATGNSLKIISGVPYTVDVGSKPAASVYMQNGEVWINFLKPNAWSAFAYGTIPYTYTQAGGEGGGTITNTKKNTDFGFSKQWIGQSAQEIAWDKDIQVTVSRNKADGSKDTSFSLVYDITKDSVDSATEGTTEYTATGGAATAPKLKLTITTEGAITKYNFSIKDLAYSSEDDGKYTYYVEETNQKLDEYLEPRYRNTSAPTGSTEAYDGGVIINQQEGGVELPHTGGIGTAVFYMFGTILVLGSGVILASRRRIKRKGGGQ